MNIMDQDGISTIIKRHRTKDLSVTLPCGDSVTTPVSERPRSSVTVADTVGNTPLLPRVSRRDSGTFGRPGPKVDPTETKHKMQGAGYPGSRSVRPPHTMKYRCDRGKDPQKEEVS